MNKSTPRYTAGVVVRLWAEIPIKATSLAEAVSVASALTIADIVTLRKNVTLTDYNTAVCNMADEVVFDSIGD